jgi:large-conductance mechanosensitive channel
MAKQSRARQRPTATTRRVTSGSTIRIEAPRSKRGEPKTVVKVTQEINPVGGFVDFLREHAIVGLAVGFAIGTQAQTLVKQLVTSFIDPAFSLLFGKALQVRTFTWHFRSHTGIFGWGAFVYSLLDFIFVLAAIYAIINFFNLDKLDKPKQ